MCGDELKHALMNFHQIYRWWTDNSNRIDSIIHEMEGIKGIRYDREVSKGVTQINVDERMINLISKKDELIVSSKHYEKMVNEVYDFVEWLDEPYKSMIKDKYFKEISDTKLEKRYGYHRTQIWRIINNKVNDFKKMQHATHKKGL